MKIETPISGGLVALMVVIIIGAVVAHFVDAPGDIRIPAIKLVPASKASAATKPRWAAGAPMRPSEQEVEVRPTLQVLEAKEVREGDSCSKLTKLPLRKCIELTEQAGRPVTWHRDTSGRTTITAPADLRPGEVWFQVLDHITARYSGRSLPRTRKRAARARFRLNSAVAIVLSFERVSARNALFLRLLW